MPYSKCPKCGVIFHLLVTDDLEKWYEENAPKKQVGEQVDLLCLKCWKEKDKI